MANPAQLVRHKLLNTFFSRHSVWFACITIAVIFTIFHIGYEPRYIYYFMPATLVNTLWIVSILLSLLGLYDVLQNRHSILKITRLWVISALSLKNSVLKFVSILLKRIGMPCHFHVCSAVWCINGLK